MSLAGDEPVDMVTTVDPAVALTEIVGPILEELQERLEGDLIEADELAVHAAIVKAIIGSARAMMAHLATVDRWRIVDPATGQPTVLAGRVWVEWAPGSDETLDLWLERYK